jgi:hypothetical protein
MLRDEARGLIVKKVVKHIEEFKLEESQAPRLLNAAKSFFCDSTNIWPLHYSAYYLGHVPRLDKMVSNKFFSNSSTYTHFLHNLHGDFYLAGIHLASQICGMVQRDMVRRREGVL